MTTAAWGGSFGKMSNPMPLSCLIENEGQEAFAKLSVLTTCLCKY